MFLLLLILCRWNHLLYFIFYCCIYYVCDVYVHNLYVVRYYNIVDIYNMYVIQCVSLKGSPGKCWFTKRTKVQYICMSYLYEMLSQKVLEMSSLSTNTQLNTTLHVSEGGCQMHLASLLMTD
jgi:hypothetical protein